METDQAGYPRTSAPAQRGQAAGRRPQGADGHHLRAEERHALAFSAEGNELRLRTDVLAALEGMAEGRRLGHDASVASEPSAGEGQDRFFPRDCGLVIGAGCFWGAKTGPNATDRRKLGSKHHIITDAGGVPLAVKLTGANRHDVTQLVPLVESIPPIAGKAGRPRKRPECVQGDRAYDSQPHRAALRKLGIDTLLAKRGTEHGSGLGVFRWVVERTISWLRQFRRLRVRYERRDDIHEALLILGCILICLYFV